LRNNVPAKLLHNHYGKSGIRLTKVTCLPDRHELVEMTVNVRLEGDFARSYTHGDNSRIVATDSIKNTVYILAKEHPVDSPESFALHLAAHFVKTYEQVSWVDVEIDQSARGRIDVGGQPHPTAFESTGDHLRSASVTVFRQGHDPRVCGGISNLLILKTTDSAFAGFVRDRYTTLPEVNDRILATRLSAQWNFDPPEADYNAAFARIRRTMLETFARHKSDSVQQTLYDMAAAALAAEPAIHSIHLRMPNKHRIPFDFKPFGLKFENDVFVTTDEPSGEISAHLQRE
jgi:urate oxidase